MKELEKPDHIVNKKRRLIVAEKLSRKWFLQFFQPEYGPSFLGLGPNLPTTDPIQIRLQEYQKLKQPIVDIWDLSFSSQSNPLIRVYSSRSNSNINAIDVHVFCTTYAYTTWLLFEEEIERISVDSGGSSNDSGG
ncbi:Uncharacterized protein Adt_19849 [Abeliophyllum distichum]|uniref:Uncharacterized protein n=1 Tax=Abeliophyllum distichum TaxID=126358 RepID=A0ABD1SU34_9LAMI